MGSSIMGSVNAYCLICSPQAICVSCLWLLVGGAGNALGLPILTGELSLKHGPYVCNYAFLF
uniref:Uncharacterized protein n=1 Tax=Anguilla anguilla TaxID=7936 RepID=A0A0E9WP33_ANGAN